MRRITHLLTTALVAVAGHGAQAQTQELGFTLDPILLGSAFRDDRALLDAPVAATVLDADALANRQAAGFEALIGDIPGLTIDGGPRGMAQEPNIRGFRDQQIVLRFDGGRFNYSQGHRGRFFVDPALIGRVEVVRGGGSTLFGSGALGGVISVETSGCGRPDPARSDHGRAGQPWLQQQWRTGDGKHHAFRRLRRF